MPLCTAEYKSVTTKILFFKITVTNYPKIKHNKYTVTEKGMEQNEEAINIISSIPPYPKRPTYYTPYHYWYMYLYMIFHR